jgi:hypothetical protein
MNIGVPKNSIPVLDGVIIQQNSLQELIRSVFFPVTHPHAKDKLGKGAKKLYNFACMPK